MLEHCVNCGHPIKLADRTWYHVIEPQHKPPNLGWVTCYFAAQHRGEPNNHLIGQLATPRHALVRLTERWASTTCS